jgi:hypothetical protein
METQNHQEARINALSLPFFPRPSLRTQAAKRRRPGVRSEPDEAQSTISSHLILKGNVNITTSALTGADIRKLCCCTLHGRSSFVIANPTDRSEFVSLEVRG